MTITLTKTRLAVAILAVAMLVPTTAYAFHVFDDVPDDAFYAAPVEWAFDNDITTGKSPTQFAPLDNVTRGESVTFLKRYNDNVVEPADAALQADIDALEALPQVVGFATVLADGSVVEERSRGVADANITLEATSAFCFYALPFEFAVALATPLYPATASSVELQATVSYPGVDLAFPGALDCSGTDPLLEVATDEAGTFTALPFTVVFYG